MTRKEAINILHGIQADNLNLDDIYTKDKYDALDMAIKALEQEPCKDVISRQAAMNCFKKWQPYMATRLWDFEKELSELPPVIPLEQEPKWIPVSKRLPKPGEYVGDVPRYYLVQNEYGDMLVAKYTHGEYWEQIYQLKPIGDEIVAWMPLPELYKIESEDKNE